MTWGGFADRVGPRSRTPGGRVGAQAAHSLRQVPAGDGAGADSCLRMPGEEEERAFLAAREELASALRKDSGQVFSMEQLLPLLATSLPPAARYLQLDAARLVRCNAHGEVRPGPAREGDRGPEPRAGLTALRSLTAPSPETTSTPCPRP